MSSSTSPSATSSSSSSPSASTFFNRPTRAQTFADDRIYIPPTDDDEDSPSTATPLAPNHNQPTASRYMHRLLHAYHGTPASVNPLSNPAFRKPDNFHTLTHWMKMYVYAVTSRDPEYEALHAPGGVFAADVTTTRRGSLGVQRGDVKLQNLCVDVVREYYREKKITASAFRIENLYAALPGEGEGALLKNFLLETAAWRIVEEGKDTGLKVGMKELVRNGGEKAEESGELTRSFEKMLKSNPAVMADFIPVLVRAAKSGAVDPREDENEVWHVSEE